jgi:hypothetical protein
MNVAQPSLDLQQRCELGQRHLMAMQYLAAERTLAEAAEEAWGLKDFDTLARLYMPLQEARRQKRQRAGEGIVCLDLLAETDSRQPDPRRIAEEIPHGQILIAGWGSIEPAIQLRRLQAEHSQYAETFLAAVYPMGSCRIVAIVPLPDVKLPAPAGQSPDELAAALPPEAIVLPAEQLPAGRHKGTAQTFGLVSSLWERLYSPFLSRAELESDPIKRISAYQLAIQVDYACEFAHQRLAAVAKGLTTH